MNKCARGEALTAALTELRKKFDLDGAVLIAMDKVGEHIVGGKAEGVHYCRSSRDEKAARHTAYIMEAIRGLFQWLTERGLEAQNKFN